MTKTKARSWTMSIAGAAAAFGLVAIVHGAAMAWRPAGWLLGGLFVVLPAVFIAYSAFRESH